MILTWVKEPGQFPDGKDRYDDASGEESPASRLGPGDSLFLEGPSVLMLMTGVADLTSDISIQNLWKRISVPHAGL